MGAALLDQTVNFESSDLHDAQEAHRHARNHRAARHWLPPGTKTAELINHYNDVHRRLYYGKSPWHPPKVVLSWWPPKIVEITTPTPPPGENARDLERIRWIMLELLRLGRWRMQQLQTMVEVAYCLPLGESCQKSRSKRCCRPRQAIYAIAWFFGDRSSMSIGRYFSRDHSTVLHGMKFLCSDVLRIMADLDLTSRNLEHFLSDRD